MNNMHEPPAPATLQAKHIVVVDDDTRIRQLLGRFFKAQGFIVSLAKDAAETFAILEHLRADMLILDVMLPGKSGLEILKLLRKSSNMPVIMLTAIGDMSKKIEGLSEGADDYLTKPFDPKELVLRVRNILNRTQARPTTGAQFPMKIVEKLCWEEMEYSIQSRQLLHRGLPMLLSKSETELLTILARQVGAVVPREVLANLLGGIHVRSLDVQVARLRQKIEKDPKNPSHLKTVRGRGYCLDVTVLE